MRKIKKLGSFIYLFLISWIVLSAVYFVFNGISISYSKGSSMEPTLKNGRVEFSKEIDPEEINRFDVICFYHGNEILEKRVLGMPGETVVLDHNDLYVNGELIKQPFQINAINDNLKNYYWEYTLSDDEFFCVGDNRVTSYDCRYFGPVKENEIKDKYIEHFTDNVILNYILETPMKMFFSLIKFISQ